MSIRCVLQYANIGTVIAEQALRKLILILSYILLISECSFLQLQYCTMACFMAHSPYSMSGSDTHNTL